MIIVLAHDDPDLLESARQQSQDRSDVFGQTYLAGDGAIPTLAVSENVFFLGHGTTQGASGQAEVGDQDADSRFSFDGAELWESFKEIFPPGYTGNVFVSACEAADFEPDLLSVIETFKTRSSSTLENTRVFGETGSPGYEIPEPGDAGWIEAGDVGTKSPKTEK